MKSPVKHFTHALTSLSAILKKAEAHCEEHKIDPDAFLSARLFPDMLNLTRNVLISCDTAKGLAARMSQTENSAFEDNEKTFAELQARIAKTIEFMNSVPDAGFEGYEGREIVMKFGPEERKFDGESYYNGFAIPNFYFHMSTVYAILRSGGLDIGKRDFLGAS